MRRPLLICLLLCVLILPANLLPAEDPCSSLTPEQKALADEILGSQHPYDCCDKTIAECLGENPRCRLAVRMAGQVCRLVGEGASRSDVERALAHRASTMMESFKKARIDLTTAAIAGEMDAPVVMTAYLCVRCPFCSKLLPWVYEEVTGGALKGKVKLALKLFPIKGHPGSVEGGLAAMAAYEQGKLYEFMFHAYRNFDVFCVDRLPAWAKTSGLDMAAYAASVENPATRVALVASKREGIANGVDSTPTLFLNGRKVHGKMDRETLMDIMEEEVERTGGKIYQ